MPDSGFTDRPGLDELSRSDLLLDALAERQRIDVDDPNDDALATLLGDWRDDLRWPPASALVSPEEAVGALRAGMLEQRRSRRGLATVGSVAATLLALSGFGAMVVEARPGGTLYGLHSMFFDEPLVNQNQTMLSAKADLAKVQQLIDKGQWTQAENQLAEVSSTVQSLNDSAGRKDLLDEIDLLNAKVDSRDPNATLPPAAPAPNSAVFPAPQSQISSIPKAITPSATLPAPSQAPSPAPGHHRH
ncbi:anti-sigma-D factor RsdA [Mycobacterium sp. Aquia_213]|uniref:anti-sigma-D factor RsdA n=1 Tax=Mycobacterium sp. Aquia_213 TaxID=2991728 RepID=UPI002D1E468A|nr:anti-sigma-D factor RsdA [Mycobacterium sp. Aquia_213]